MGARVARGCPHLGSAAPTPMSSSRRRRRWSRSRHRWKPHRPRRYWAPRTRSFRGCCLVGVWVVCGVRLCGCWSLWVGWGLVWMWVVLGCRWRVGLGWRGVVLCWVVGWVVWLVVWGGWLRGGVRLGGLRGLGLLGVAVLCLCFLVRGRSGWGWR